MDSVTRTRKIIVDAASDQFDLYGPHKTTMISVASIADVARATLYLHFPNKRALYAATLTKATDEMAASVGALLLEPISAQMKLRRWVELTASTYSDNKVFFSAIAEEAEFTIKEVAESVLQEHRKQLLVMLTNILAQGVAVGDLRDINVTYVAELMYDLGTIVVVNALSGKTAAPLSDMLGVMDDLFHRGISTT